MKDLEEYIRYLTYERHYSDYTVTNYESDILEFFDYLDSEGLNYLKIEYSDIRGYLSLLFDKKKDDSSTVSRKISSLRGFYKYLVNNEVIKNNVFRLVSLPKKAKKLPKYFYYNELEELFSVNDLSTPLGQRDNLILEMLYATGVRVSELVNIKISDINHFDKTIKIFGKGSKERIVLYGNNCSKILDKYLSDGRNILLNGKKNDYLIIGLNKTKGLSTRSVELIIDKIINKAALNKNVTPHVFRHTFATHLLNEGCDILVVKELLGHSSLDTTGIYTHVSNEYLRKVYLDTHPRARR